MDETLTLLIEFLNADPFLSNEEAAQLRRWPRSNDNAAGVTPRRFATPSPTRRDPMYRSPDTPVTPAQSG